MAVYRSRGDLELLVVADSQEKAHKHKTNFPVTARVAGVLPTGWPGVKRLCAVCGTQGI